MLYKRELDCPAMSEEVTGEVDGVWLVARYLSRPGQPDGESDYIVYARDGRSHSPPILVTKPGGAQAALDIAANDPWVLDHRRSDSFRS